MTGSPDRKDMAKMTVYGYGRVSTLQQDLASQKKHLKEAGCEIIYSEKASGKSASDRQQLQELKAVVKPGDTVKVTKLDRLGRSLSDLSELVKEFNTLGVTVVFIDNSMTFSPGKQNATDTLMLQILASFAEFERSMINSRIADGKAYKKANNPNWTEGRPKRKITAKHLKWLELMESNSVKEVANIVGVSERTLYRIQKQYREEQEAKQLQQQEK